MAKPIYCTLILLVVCFAHEAHGIEHHTIVRHFRSPPQAISHKENPYGLSSSSGADALESDSAAKLSSLLPSLTKSFSLNSQRGSFSSPFIYDRNKGVLQDIINQSLRGPSYLRSQPSDNTEPGVQNQKRLNSMMPEFMNDGLLDGLYNNRNSQINTNSENPNTKKRQNSMTSESQDFPNATPMTNNPLARRVLSSQPSNSPSSDDDSQQTDDGDDEIKDSKFKPLSLQGHNLMVMSVRQCCINGINGRNCRTLKDGEECNFDGLTTNSNKKTAQQPNNAMLMTPGNYGLHGMMLNLMKSNFDKGAGQNSFGKFADASDSNEEDNVKAAENENSTNMMQQPGLKRLLTKMNSFGGFDNDNDMMGPYTVMPKKREPKTYQPSNPIGFTKDEANKIRNAVLDKSNFYRRKFQLVPFTLDEQLNNCAQDWANHIAETNTNGHRPNQDYGENLYSSTDARDLGEKAVKSWYNEIIIFTLGGTESQLFGNMGTHHMTQLLWKSSTKLGVGVSKSPNGWYNVVANYDPAGNVRNSFLPNLPVITKKEIKEANDAINAEKQQKPQFNYGSFY